MLQIAYAVPRANLRGPNGYQESVEIVPIEKLTGVDLRWLAAKRREEARELDRLADARRAQERAGDAALTP